jgi:RNA polymerase sigma factor (sigma-70 family)
LNAPDEPTPESREDDAHEPELRALIESLRPDLVRRLGSLHERELGAHESTDDLVSESMRRFLATVRARGLHAMPRAEAWGLLSTIAHRLLVDGLRRHQVRSKALTRLRVELALESPELEPAVAVELRELVERTMGAMTADERAIVSRRLGGASWAEISRETGVGEEALRQRWAALRRRLRELVEGE